MVFMIIACSNRFDFLKQSQEVIILVDVVRSAGRHTASWNGTDSRRHEVASGIYFYRLETKDFSATKKMVFMK